MTIVIIAIFSFLVGFIIFKCLCYTYVPVHELVWTDVLHKRPDKEMKVKSEAQFFTKSFIDYKQRWSIWLRLALLTDDWSRWFNCIQIEAQPVVVRSRLIDMLYSHIISKNPLGRWRNSSRMQDFHFESIRLMVSRNEMNGEWRCVAKAYNQNSDTIRK